MKYVFTFADKIPKRRNYGNLQNLNKIYLEKLCLKISNK